jgi:hypothetical protein
MLILKLRVMQFFILLQMLEIFMITSRYFLSLKSFSQTKSTSLLSVPLHWNIVKYFPSFSSSPHNPHFLSFFSAAAIVNYPLTRHDYVLDIRLYRRALRGDICWLVNKRFFNVFLKAKLLQIQIANLFFLKHISSIRLKT